MFEKLMKEIEYSKTCVTAREQFFMVYGEIKMAFELNAITKEEYLKLNHECVANGINNPKYFD